MRKLFGKKNILSLIFGLLMMLPFFSIMARCIYVQSNPNAMNSYSGTSVQYQKQLKYQTNEVDYTSQQTFEDTMIFGNIYKMHLTYDYDEMTQPLDVVVDSGINSYLMDIRIDNPNEMTIFTHAYQDSSLFFKNNYPIEFDYLTIALSLAYFYDSTILDMDSIDDNTTIEFMINAQGDTYFYVDLFFIFNVYGELYDLHRFFYDLLPLSQEELESFGYEYVEIASSTLDNVFDYSLSSFVEDNNFGINWFQWFDNTFLTQSGHNMIYLNFANWYLNYAMIVSTAYILFLAMIWFVYFARSLFEKFMNYDGGGF